MGRYRAEPKDLVDTILDLQRRVASLSNNPRIGNTAIDSGQLTVRNGDIVIEDGGGVDVLHFFRQNIFGRPEIRFNPQGTTSTKVSSIYSTNESIDGTVQSALKMEILNASTQLLDGGFIHAYQTASKMGYSPAAGGSSYIQIGTVNGVTGRIHFKGHFSNQFAQTTSDALYVSTINTGGGFGSQTHTFPVTFIGFMRPIASLLNSGGVVSWNITAFSNSAVTISWSGTASKNTNIWVFRL